MHSCLQEAQGTTGYQRFCRGRRRHQQRQWHGTQLAHCWQHAVSRMGAFVCGTHATRTCPHSSVRLLAEPGHMSYAGHHVGSCSSAVRSSPASVPQLSTCCSCVPTKPTVTPVALHRLRGWAFSSIRDTDVAITEMEPPQQRLPHRCSLEQVFVASCPHPGLLTAALCPALYRICPGTACAVGPSQSATSV